MAKGTNYCGPVNTRHNFFCLDILENLMKNCPGGSYIGSMRTPRVTGGIPHMYIVYKYNYRKVLGFIANEGSGST